MDNRNATGMPGQNNLILRIVCGVIIAMPLLTRIDLFFDVWRYLFTSYYSYYSTAAYSVFFGFIFISVIFFVMGYLATGVLVIVKQYRYIKFSIPVIGLGFLVSLAGNLIFHSMEGSPFSFHSFINIFSLAYIVFVTILCFVDKNDLILRCKWVLWIAPIIIFVINISIYAPAFRLFDVIILTAFLDCLAHASIGIVMALFYVSKTSKTVKVQPQSTGEVSNYRYHYQAQPQMPSYEKRDSNVMFCEKCGTRLRVGVNYCYKCGAEVIRKE